MKVLSSFASSFKKVLFIEAEPVTSAFLKFLIHSQCCVRMVLFWFFFIGNLSQNLNLWKFLDINFVEKKTGKTNKKSWLIHRKLLVKKTQLVLLNTIVKKIFLYN